jgi:hypothetical protein
MECPVFRSCQRRLSSSVTLPSWTIRFSERSSGSISLRFSRHRRMRLASSLPIIIRASEPPRNPRLDVPRRFASPKDQVAWSLLRDFGATLWKGRPKFAVNPLPAMPSQEPQRTAEAVRRALPDLLKLYRYEARAVTRRDRAIRAITLRSKTSQLQSKIVHDAFCKTNPICPCIYRCLCVLSHVFAQAPYATNASERLLHHRIRAGVPKAFEPVGMSRFTNEFAPMITLSPMVRPIWITALGPI